MKGFEKRVGKHAKSEKATKSVEKELCGASQFTSAAGIRDARTMRLVEGRVAEPPMLTDYD